MERTGKIFFYEDKNFQGHYYECSSDCPELSSHFSRCNSIRVEGGAWVIYERPQYMGYQYILMKGEYPNYQSWNGFNETIRSCRLIRQPSSRYRIRIYERPDFSGQMMELSQDLPNLQDRWRYRDIHSANVQDGIWVFYENPNYRGRQYLLEKGEYRRHSEWGLCTPLWAPLDMLLTFNHNKNNSLPCFSLFQVNSPANKPTSVDKLQLNGCVLIHFYYETKLKEKG